MAKVEILAFASGLPRTDLSGAGPGTVEAARSVLSQLFPGRIGVPLDPADLLTAGYPEYGRIYAGSFGGATVICGQDLLELVDLGATVTPLGDPRNVFRLQINSAIDSMALEILAPDGTAVRELMLVAAEGVIFDVGPHLDFENRYWSGDSDADGVFAGINGPDVPFDVNDFGEEALRELFGFVIDTDPRRGDLDPGAIRLHGFVIAADSADPSDMASVRSGGPAPVLPAEDFSGDGSATGVGGGAGRPTAVSDPVPDPSAADRLSPDAGGSWWKRLTRRLFG